jgi:hypothetical protein
LNSPFSVTSVTPIFVVPVFSAVNPRIPFAGSLRSGFTSMSVMSSMLTEVLAFSVPVGVNVMVKVSPFFTVLSGSVRLSSGLSGSVSCGAVGCGCGCSCVEGVVVPCVVSAVVSMVVSVLLLLLHPVRVMTAAAVIAVRVASFVVFFISFVLLCGCVIRCFRGLVAC